MDRRGTAPAAHWSPSLPVTSSAAAPLNSSPEFTYPAPSHGPPPGTAVGRPQDTLPHIPCGDVLEAVWQIRVRRRENVFRKNQTRAALEAKSVLPTLQLLIFRTNQPPIHLPSQPADDQAHAPLPPPPPHRRLPPCRIDLPCTHHPVPPSHP